MLQPFLVRQVLLPGNVSWKHILKKDSPLFEGKSSLAGARPTGNLAPWIDERAAISVGSGVLGMTQNAVQCGRRWLPPLQLSLVGAIGESHGHADSILAQVPEYLPSGAKLLEFLEDQPDDRLDLLIGIKDHFP
ncbi:MAG: hypothetical protein A2V98_17160 [Planctomycetes bacterium RBG_16_64_12]|nr:MAG: hypothetical protein A2V98_17160 [Planctomycetes bacterium RBG_16_64_12]